jgi:prolactin regulatory element-binding protein
LFLVSTSLDGSARIWKIDEGVPLVNLTQFQVCFHDLCNLHLYVEINFDVVPFSPFSLQDEKIECCRFSRDGMKPFLFCTVAKGVLSMAIELDDTRM